MIGMVNKSRIENLIKLRFLQFLVSLQFVYSSCSDNYTKGLLHERTVIVYMIADNNLDCFSVEDINEMEKGWDIKQNGNLIVYLDRAEGANPAHPVVYKIRNDTSQNIVSDIIMIYPEQNSADKTVMNKVLKDIIHEYPAHSYGLVLWSHGSAWVPKGTSLDPFKTERSQIKPNIAPLTKAFGKDKSDEIDITELKSSLPVLFDFIIFDACYMGSIEVVYELRKKTKFIISSSTEIISTGYPYESIVPLLFETSINYCAIADSFFTAYNKLENAFQSATVSVVNTDELNALAKCVSQIMADTANFNLLDIYEIQQFTRSQNGFLFDLSDFIFRLTINDSFADSFMKTLSKTVIHKASTDYILDQLEISRFSGLSIFIPYKEKSNFIDFYMNYEWFKDSNVRYYINQHLDCL